MTSLYHTAQVGQVTLKNTTNTFGVKNLNMRHRNYSNSRLNLQQPIDLQFVKQTIQTKKPHQQTNSTSNSHQFKKYCLNKLKTSTGTDKFNAIRKNRSLKVMAKHPSNQRFNRTKVQPLMGEELFIEKKQENEEQSTKLISIKRRVELIKINSNKRKLTLKIKESAADKEMPKSDVSLGSKIQFCLPEQEKPSTKIQSENLLGMGLKKSSSSKIKILVKNPFERLMKLQQNKKQASTSQVSIEQLHQSQIVQKMDQSHSTFSNRCELEEMLALI